MKGSKNKRLKYTLTDKATKEHWDFASLESCAEHLTQARGSLVPWFRVRYVLDPRTAKRRGDHQWIMDNYTLNRIAED